MVCLILLLLFIISISASSCEIKEINTFFRTSRYSVPNLECEKCVINNCTSMLNSAMEGNCCDINYCKGINCEIKSNKKLCTTNLNVEALQYYVWNITYIDKKSKKLRSVDYTCLIERRYVCDTIFKSKYCVGRIRNCHNIAFFNSHILRDKC